MLRDMPVTVDFLRYKSPGEYEGWLYIYVHEFDRILKSNFQPLGCPTSLYFLEVGYKKNMGILLSLDGDTSDIILLKDEAQDTIMTSLYSVEIKIIGTFIGYEEDTEEKVAKVLANNFIFKVHCLSNKPNNLIQGQKIYISSLLTMDYYDEFHDRIANNFAKLNICRDDVEGWPNDKSLWPDPGLKVGKGESPLEQLVISSPEYVKKKLGREHCKNYPIYTHYPCNKEDLEIDADDLKAIEHLIQK